MTRWKHKVDTRKGQSCEEAYDEEYLNHMSMLGWRLISVVLFPGVTGNSFKYYFRRPV